MNTEQTDLCGNALATQLLNVAAYKFVLLTQLVSRRDNWRVLAKSLEIRGTVLLSQEGINLFIAGEPTAVRAFLAALEDDSEIGPLDLKESYSDEQPFNRMLVKIKKEIIAFGVPGIDPVTSRTAKISPRELKAWLDEGRPCVLLDVRNDYEVELGTFENAVPIGVAHFRDFPAAVDRLAPEKKQQPVVMFCTGGIRCEKAGPFMEQAGFQHVLQLDGGILKYFEECGGDHYRGECFVFDKRVGLDADLRETETEMCFVCQHLLSAEDQQSPDYVVGERCPFCN